MWLWGEFYANSPEWLSHDTVPSGRIWRGIAKERLRPAAVEYRGPELLGIQPDLGSQPTLTLADLRR